MRTFGRAVRMVAAAVIAVLFLTVPAMGAATGVITTPADEYNPAASDTYIAWNLWTGKHAVVYAKQQVGGTKFRVNPSGTDAYVGSIDGTTLIYQQYVPSQGTSDVYAYDLSTKIRTKVAKPVSTRGWEYDPTGSGDWVMFARYYRNADRKIFLYNTSTLELREVASSAGRGTVLRASQISGNYAVWEKDQLHKGNLYACNVYLYDILGATVTKLDNPNARCQYSPAVNPTGTVYLARSGYGCGKNLVLQQVPLGGSASTFVDMRDGHDITSLYAVDNGDTTTDVYYDPYRCGHQADIVKVTEP